MRNIQTYRPYKTIHNNSQATNRVSPYPLGHKNVQHGNNVFTYEVSVPNQIFIVPSGISEITVQLWGATGQTNGALGGAGGYVKGILPVLSGERLNIHVGDTGDILNSRGGSFGYGYYGANGGDYSAIYTSGGHRLVVVGAGGGCGGQSYNGGIGGGLTGGGATSGTGVAHGATQTAGGVGAPGNTANGATGTGPVLFSGGVWNQTGGNGTNTGSGNSGGGGGGYYGGGGGAAGGAANAGGGGGGSAFVGNLTGPITNTFGGHTGTNLPGKIIISY